MHSKVSMLPSLQEQVETANTECERLQNELQLVTDVKVGEISRLRKQVSELERVHEKKLFETPNEKDDLKKINGIGQVLEQTLNKIGITAFQQIARFTEQDVKQVDDALQVFQGRIVRDNWIGGARVEYKKKYGKSI
jgi:predicted flap endonuclease-1-like 5' DNA nuclease